MANEEKTTPDTHSATEQSEISVESEAPSEGGEQAQEAAPETAEMEDIQRLLEDARTKADEHWNELLRARAELENQRRRHERELEKARKYALEKFAQELLPVKDSLEMGLAAAQAEDADVAALREGTELILKMFDEVAARFGIETVDPQGEAFNPEFHQAISTQENDEVAPNTVLIVVRKGYVLNGRLLRPAMVVVSKPSEQIPPGVDTQA
ncbi:nucleotide exchange factor GrpE [Nitrosococcus wardiae]|uniref:Protein GrpE n=1 Tax=Nitrosococcus wardiae TaxID=1814290 RepID=A0A4P7BWE8_9GAMM|nr:nucleotide exchange factor GrpE [Nitrosococcus wardiae]QBQ54271.1 nucleotide exchange factor GrpE [Nitrosococcus wardiae]